MSEAILDKGLHQLIDGRHTGVTTGPGVDPAGEITARRSVGEEIVPSAVTVGEPAKPVPVVSAEDCMSRMWTGMSSRPKAASAASTCSRAFAVLGQLCM